MRCDSFQARDTKNRKCWDAVVHRLAVAVHADYAHCPPVTFRRVFVSRSTG